MNYTFKVWLFTIIVSPLLLFLALLIVNDSKFDSVLDSSSLIFIMFICGFIFSIPAMIIFQIIQSRLIKKIKENKLKIILSIYSFISVWITFYILDKGFIERGIEQLLWVIIYSITIVLGVWIFKNRKAIKEI
ncbi:hypothetical protein [Flavobacterium sp. 3HN19-14]|uniref:hypothetical protein n=1 Tax=Flavobacterium sp. 3HN19-14 TaxID=3448133 RepID=UPI003EE18204